MTIRRNLKVFERAGEYCSHPYPVALDVPPRRSLAFAAQLAGNLASSMPLSISRYCSAAMRQQIAKVVGASQFDSIVCDFLAPAPNFADMSGVVLFQHNVESMIWRRHVEQAPDPLRKAYFKMQADRMFEWERRVCRAAARVIAVSPQDVAVMRDLFGIEAICVATGVDLEYFRRPPDPPRKADLVFVGSMDWLPNSDGVNYFVREILPLIWQRKPDCTLAIVGRIAVAGDASIGAAGLPDPGYGHGSRCSAVAVGSQRIDRPTANRRRYPAEDLRSHGCGHRNGINFHRGGRA